MDSDDRSTIVARRLSVPLLGLKKKTSETGESPLLMSPQPEEEEDKVPPGGEEIIQRTESIVTAWWTGDWNAFVALSTRDCSSFLPGQNARAIKVGFTSMQSVSQCLLVSHQCCTACYCYCSCRLQPFAKPLAGCTG